MEYIQNKLTQLAESLLEPVWAWVMARSWIFRACVLALGGVIFLAWFKPGIVSENYRLGISTWRVAMADEGHIALDFGTKDKLSSATKRLENTVKSELTHFVGLEPWSIAQAIVAVEEGEQRTNRAPYAQEAISRIRGNETTGGCFCWAEVPRASKDTDEVAMVIAGWVMLAFSHLGETISDSEVTYILGAQKAEGWWPTFRDKNDETFASTYSTAWNVLGLAEMSSQNLISSAMRSRVEGAIARGAAWLQRTRTDSAKWRSYPNKSDSPKVSESISGLVLHTLHVAGISDLRYHDRNWLSGLPREPPEALELEPNFIELRGSNIERIDHFSQVKLPWMLIATVDAYPSGDIFQKGRARSWIDAALSKPSVLTADADANNWARAEVLYALKYLGSRLAAK
jgi:hypothetical protein